MTQRTFVALLTVVMFAAGYAVRTVTEGDQHVPPPPTALTNEFPAATPPADAKNKAAIDRAKLVAEIEKLRPQIEAYRSQVDEIFGEFDREFGNLLTSAQREKYAANQKKYADMMAKQKADQKPLSDEDIVRARERPLTDIYWMITVTPRLEHLTKDYELTEAQQASTRALLTLRRNKFLALLDGTPHPSIRLSRLAPMIERVQATKK